MNLGGIGIYTLSLAKALKERGEEIIVASSGGELVKDLKKKGIEHIYIPVDTSADIGIHTIRVYLSLAGLIKERGIDIIHAQTRVTQVIACLLSKRLNVGFVATCHGFFKKKWFRRLCPCWGSRTIAISDAVRQHLVHDMGVSKEKVRLIYNGIDTARFKRSMSPEDRAHIRKEFGLKNIPTIGIISRLSDVKGHKYLLGAFAKIIKKIPNTQLLIVGDGRPGYLKSLKDQAERLAISANVIFRRGLKDIYIPLSVIDVFCMPSVQEGLGLSILEAMAAGVPVVASDVGGIYTLIQHGKNGLLVPPRNEDALADAIAKMLSDKEMAKEMVNASRSMIEEKFTINIMRDKVLNVYEELKESK